MLKEANLTDLEKVLTKEQIEKMEVFFHEVFPHTPFAIFCLAQAKDGSGDIYVSALRNVPSEFIAPHILKSLTDWLPEDQFIVTEVSPETLEFVRQLSATAEKGEA